MSTRLTRSELSVRAVAASATTLASTREGSTSSWELLPSVSMLLLSRSGVFGMRVGADTDESWQRSVPREVTSPVRTT